MKNTLQTHRVPSGLDTRSLPRIELSNDGIELRVNITQLAKLLGIKRRSLSRLISEYRRDFEEFGILRFQIAEIKGRGQPEKVAELNENQAYLLLTYSKNTAKARACKVALVKAFQLAREGLDIDPLTLALRASLDTRERVSVMEQKVKKLDAQVSTITTNSDNYTVKAYARLNAIFGFDRRMAAAIGKRASALCREKGIATGKTKDEAYGFVQNYPEAVLKEVFANFGYVVGEA